MTDIPLSRQMRSKSRLMAVAAAVATLLLLLPSCARNKPAEFPDRYGWQKRTAPMDYWKDDSPGVISSVSVYATDTPPLPSEVEQQFERADFWVPSRLDIICSDRTGTGDNGRTAIVFSVSDPILSAWHPSTWESWAFEFSNTLDSNPDKDRVEIGIDGENRPPALDKGFLPYVDDAEKVDELREVFKKHAGKQGATLEIVAQFPDGAGKTPLEWDFQIGSESNAGSYMKDISERCGEVW